MLNRIFAWTLIAAGMASPAFANARLEQRFPRAGEVLSAAPGQVQLSFSEQLEPAPSGIAITGPGGRSFAAGRPRIGGQAMDQALKPLPAGRYHVAWHAVSVDQQRTEGGYDFTVK